MDSSTAEQMRLLTSRMAADAKEQGKVFVAAVPRGKSFDEKWGDRIGEFSFSWAGYYRGMARKGSWVRLALGDIPSKERVKDLATIRTAVSIRPIGA